MSSVSRQDMQTMLDQTCRRLQDQIATRQDVQRAADGARDRMISYMHDYLQQNQQQFIRQLDDRARIQKTQVTNLENRIHSLEQEIKSSHQLISNIAQKQTSVVIPRVQEAISNRRNYRFAQES